MDQYHKATHSETIRLRKTLNDMNGTLDRARNAIHWSDHVMEKVNIMGNIAKEMNIEDLDSDAFIRNIHLYIEDYMKKIEKHVLTMERYGRL